MDQISTADCEGLIAQVNALRMAQEALRHGAPDAVRMVRNITQALQKAPALPQASEILQLSVRLEKAGDDILIQELEEIVPRLRHLTAEFQTDKVSLLIVEDDRATAELLRRRLAVSHRDIYIAESVHQAEKIMTEREIALILLDLHLPDGDGRNFAVRLRERTFQKVIPIIAISAQTNLEVKAECFALGIDAYFEKPFDLLTLSTVVASRLQTTLDLQRRATQDALTGLPNRAAFYQAFAFARMLMARSGAPLAIGVVDLDRFKEVNDLYGHLMGDEVLRRLSQTIARSLRRSDFVARWGGEEFSIFFPNADVETAQMALQKALEVVREEQFMTPDGRSFFMSFSAGLAPVREGETMDQSLAEADQMLYLAKAAGRNRVLTPFDHVPSFKKNILIVEDDHSMAALVKQHLRRDGFRIVHARDGAQALAFAHKHALALITLDISMPGVDGFELLQQLRRIPSMHKVPILMLTSTDTKADILRGFELGASDYIIKPYAPAELRARVYRFLKAA